MNAMLYARGNALDYDGWERDHGATGWAYEAVLPLFRRHERNAEIADEFHGRDGELHVTQRRWLSPHWPAFVDAAQAAGIAHNPDYNGARQDGVSLFQTTTRRGRRWSAADAFLRPALGREDLQLVTRATARRLLISQGRVTGVEYEHRRTAVRALAEREVILCAGSLRLAQPC